MSDSANFRVPLGLDETERLTMPGEATKGEIYRCPECKSRLILRQGTKTRAHFAHKATTNCSGESVLHRTAKLLIAQVLTEGSAPDFEITCAECQRPFCVAFPRSRSVVSSVEHRLSNGRVVDVAVLYAESVALAVEVYRSSAVTEDKAADLSMPWIEVDASDIIANPLIWRARQHALKVTRCRVCRRAEEIRNNALSSALAEYRLTFNSDVYKVSPVACWKCHCVTPIFEWKDGEMWSKESPLPSPHPRTLRFVFTKTAGTRYWANHCASCGVVQGDFYLHRMISEFYMDSVDSARQELGIDDGHTL